MMSRIKDKLVDRDEVELVADDDRKEELEESPQADNGMIAVEPVDE